MLNRVLVFVSLAGVLCAGGAVADTIFLKNGVSVDGVIKQREGYIEVKAGDRTVVYRDSEIARIEQNAKTGKQDLGELAARWELEEAEMVKKTGLDALQRRRVRELVGELTKDATSRMAAREKLVAMQSEADVFRYLRFLIPDASHYQVPHIFEAMFYLDSNRAVKEIRIGTQHNYFEARAKAIELLGGIAHKESVPLMARGLADEKFEVKIQAAYALARTGVKGATPALIEMLKHPDLRVGNASRESLAALWAEVVGDEAPKTVEAWTKIWEAHQEGVSGRIQLASLQPLVLPEEEFENE